MDKRMLLRALPTCGVALALATSCAFFGERRPEPPLERRLGASAAAAKRAQVHTWVLQYDLPRGVTRVAGLDTGGRRLREAVVRAEGDGVDIAARWFDGQGDVSRYGHWVFAGDGRVVHDAPPRSSPGEDLCAECMIDDLRTVRAPPAHATLAERCLGAAAETAVRCLDAARLCATNACGRAPVACTAARRKADAICERVPLGSAREAGPSAAR